jgi:predicted ribosomally synthesized peptide with SipW-like signal peptide
LLRDVPEPSAELRERLVRAATAAPARANITPLGSYRARLLIPLAAAIVGAVLGGGGVYAWMRQNESATPVVASAPLASAGDVPVKFTYHAPAASAVAIVGDFNRWRPGGLPLRHSADGKSWEIEIPLAPGRYVYSFLVDGKLARDPGAPQVRDDDFGSPNSVLMVKGS